MQNLSIFQYNQFPVRTFADKKNELWFIANDVCDILGYINPRQAVQKNCKAKGVSTRDTPTNGGIQSMTYINEPNLYRLIIKSKKPEAEPFEEWVMEDVLPSIRKTGSYSLKTTTDQRTPLRDAVNLLVGKKGLMYPEAYSVIHQRFNVRHIDELSAEQVPMAIEYVHKLTLEAEWLPEVKRSLIESKSTYHLEPIVFPNLKNGLHPNSTQVFFDFNSMFWMREMGNAPIAMIIRALNNQGYDTAGVVTEYKSLMHLLEIYHDRLERVEKICARREGLAINIKPSFLTNT